MTVFSARVVLGSDDCDTYGGSTIDLTTATLFVNYPDLTEVEGVRIQNVTIPQGATINSATVTFRATNTNAASAGIVAIKGENADNAATFTTYANFAGRARTTAGVSWSIPINTWVSGNDQATPDIKTIVQEIVNRASWVSGNAMAFFFASSSPTAADARAHSYEGSTTLCPLLTVDYTAASAKSDIVPRPRTPYAILAR